MTQTAEAPVLSISNLVLLKDFLPPYKIGATVRLKSGGPVMTVTAFLEGHIEVQWFEGLEAKQKIYPIAAVVPARNRKRNVQSV